MFASTSSTPSPMAIQYLRDIVLVLQPEIVHFEGELLSTSLEFMFTMPAKYVEFNFMLEALVISFQNNVRCHNAFNLLDQYLIIHSEEGTEGEIEFYGHVTTLLPLVKRYRRLSLLSSHSFLSLPSQPSLFIPFSLSTSLFFSHLFFLSPLTLSFLSSISFYIYTQDFLYQEVISQQQSHQFKRNHVQKLKRFYLDQKNMLISRQLRLCLI